jgi:hypothetical protein
VPRNTDGFDFKQQRSPIEVSSSDDQEISTAKNHLTQEYSTDGQCLNGLDSKLDDDGKNQRRTSPFPSIIFSQFEPDSPNSSNKTLATLQYLQHGNSLINKQRIEESDAELMVSDGTSRKRRFH